MVRRDSQTSHQIPTKSWDFHSLFLEHSIVCCFSEPNLDGDGGIGLLHWIARSIVGDYSPPLWRMGFSAVGCPHETWILSTSKLGSRLMGTLTAAEAPGRRVSTVSRSAQESRHPTDSSTPLSARWPADCLLSSPAKQPHLAKVSAISSWRQCSWSYPMRGMSLPLHDLIVAPLQSNKPWHHCAQECLASSQDQLPLQDPLHWLWMGLSLSTGRRTLF